MIHEKAIGAGIAACFVWAIYFAYQYIYRQVKPFKKLEELISTSKFNSLSSVQNYTDYALKYINKYPNIWEYSNECTSKDCLSVYDYMNNRIMYIRYIGDKTKRYKNVRLFEKYIISCMR